jgi:hypothetical protein
LSVRLIETGGELVATSFIRPSPNHWKPGDFDLSTISLDESLLHITKTICLLESRCDDYAEYLQAILRDRSYAWTSAITRWNIEECQHCVTLRAVCEAGDHDFDFDSCMSNYKSLVTYHALTGESVRGSVAAEMVSRCVVEALASTLYRVLADSTLDRNASAVYSALGRDEARHYGMFLKMLNAEALMNHGIGFLARCRFALQRMLELEDAQIMLASCVVAGRANTTIFRRIEANWYFSRVYRFYRWGHLRYAARMLLLIVDLRATPFRVSIVSLGMWSAIKIRLLIATLASLFVPLREPKSLTNKVVNRSGDVGRI